MPREWWERLFADCGLTVAYSGTTDPATDSTGFEVGWLLRRADLVAGQSWDRTHPGVSDE